MEAESVRLADPDWPKHRNFANEPLAGFSPEFHSKSAGAMDTRPPGRTPGLRICYVTVPTVETVGFDMTALRALGASLIC